MIVFQITLDIFLLQNLPAEEATGVLCQFIDKGLCTKEEMIKFHEERKYKNYCFNSLYPVSQDKIYHKDRQYKLQIRTIDMYLAEFLSNELIGVEDRIIKVLDTQVKLLPKKDIDKLYSITSCIMKVGSHYWRDCFEEIDFSRAIQNNLIKKYQDFTGKQVDENFTFVRDITFKNRVPIACKYKEISLLGDKVELYIGDEPIAQELAYMALGTGLLEMNSRGFGFVNDKWKR